MLSKDILCAHLEEFCIESMSMKLTMKIFIICFRKRVKTSAALFHFLGLMSINWCDAL